MTALPFVEDVPAADRVGEAAGESRDRDHEREVEQQLELARGAVRCGSSIERAVMGMRMGGLTRT